MRDICFRGKRRDNGQWEYGFLSYGRDGFEIVSTDRMKEAEKSD